MHAATAENGYDRAARYSKARGTALGSPDVAAVPISHVGSACISCRITYVELWTTLICSSALVFFFFVTKWTIAVLASRSSVR